MKKSLTGMLALLAGAYAVHAQGTVSLANYLALSPYIYVSFKPAVGSAVALGGAGSGPAPTLNNYASETGNGNDWTVQLYGAPGANQTTTVPLFQSLTGPGATQSASSTFSTGGGDPSGAWNTGVVGVINGAAGNGSAASVQLAAWYNEGGAITSLATAQADGVPWGMSAIENVTTGGPAVPGLSTTPGTAASLPAIPNFNVTTTPEPSTIALGVIGASAFLMRLRRKQ